MELVLFSVASITILAGASFNIQGYTGNEGLVAMLAGLCAFAAGVLFRRWVLAILLGLAALGFHMLKAWLLSRKFVELNLVGLLGLSLGGGLGSVAFGRVTRAIRRRVMELEQVNLKLEEQRRIFLAATEESLLQSDDIIEITAYTARAARAGLCCYYLANAAGTQFLPQLPGVGFEPGRPPVLTRLGGPGDIIFAALDSGQDFHLESEAEVKASSRLLPPTFEATNLLIVPLPIGGKIGGFVLLGNREGGFTPDVRRLVATVAARAGASLTERPAVTPTSEETDPLSILAEIPTQAVGRPPEEIVELILAKAQKLIPHDSARVALFDDDDTFSMLGPSPSPPVPLVTTPLSSVADGGRTLLRSMATAADGLYSGLRPQAEGGAVSEALVPIGRPGRVLGAICLGRQGGHAFTERDLPLLDELGRAAGQALGVDNQEESLGQASEPTGWSWQ